jgi:hypothetical protein
MPPDLESSLRERVAEQVRLEQAKDVDGLCNLILPAFLWGKARSRSAESYERFVSRVRSAELVSFEVDRWLPTLETALVRYAVRYNDTSEPVRFHTIWALAAGEWYATAAGKTWPAEPGATPTAAPGPAGY